MPRVLLLIPVSSREDFQPIHRKPLPWLRNRIRRQLDRLLWRAGIAPGFHYSTYEDRHHSNRGDIAIRRASIELLQDAFGGAAEIAEIGWAEFRALNAAEIDARADLLILGGGGYYFLHDAGRLAPRVAEDAERLRQVRCPIVSLSPGVNWLLQDRRPEWNEQAAEPLPDPTRAVLGRLLGRLQLSSARDNRSRDYLNRIVPGHTVTLADPALFLRPAAPPRAVPEAPPGTLRIGLNIAFHGPNQSRLLPRRLRLYAEFARRLTRRHRCAFVYFVHSDAERAIPPLLRAAGIALAVVDLPAEQMLAWYARLDVHVCQMLHSSILSCNAGVPAVALGYDIKNAAFFETMALERYYLPDASATPERLAALVETALSERSALARHLAARKAALRREMDAYLAAIVAVTAPPGGAGA